MKSASFAAAAIGFLLSGAALADDFAGKWKITGDVAGNPVEVTCLFAGSGDKATSSCSADTTPGPETPATIAGKDVTWSWDATQAVLTFKGKLDSDKAMTGDIEVSGITGNFTGAKE